MKLGRRTKVLSRCGASALAVLTLGTAAVIADTADAGASAGDDGALHVTIDTTVDTTTGQMIPGGTVLGHIVAGSPGAPSQRVIELTTLTVDAGTTLRFVGTAVPYVTATGPVAISGVVSVSATPTTPGPGGGAGGMSGASGVTAGVGGAGGGGHSGGAGGSYWDNEYSASGTAGAGTGGVPTRCGGGAGLGGSGWPATAGMCELMSIPFRSNVHVGAGGGGGGGITQASTDLQGGSGGGAGAAGPEGEAGDGGSGAGGLRIDSATGITIGGAVVANGDNGHEPSGFAAFGGGGGGGVVWLRAPSVAIPGTVEARGGQVAFGSIGNGADGTVVINTDCSSGAGTVYPDPVVGTFSGAAGIAVDDAYATDEDTTLSVPASGVLDNDCGSSRSASIATNPAHGAVTLQPTGAFTYAPASNWHGTDSFTYSLTAGGVASGTATVTIAVAPVNDAPAAVGDSYTVPSGSSLTVPSATGVLANDSDLDGDALTAALGTNVTHGSLSLAPDGSFTYTAAAGYSGPDSFTYVAHDATAGSAVTTATISVTPLAPTLSASIEPPINADGSSVFAAKRGVVPVKFTPQADGRPTCDLPAATISLTRIGATTGAVVDEAVYTNPADGGSAFRVSGCQYVYNLSTKALGTGTYRVSIVVNGQTIGTATFALR